ncbi:UDP-N-acetylmuramate dehydrogenase [Photobacterium aphoticum]|uniref:UDP-N-acetylenolpyruvoylglucosamine reductase n=1 Tax=Photobacterium aphoticum TaxID=754436 RepID=A0A0J1GFV4_9GAMM|nr:UDP-N-acetylmuramate dehydrogenase [Photobacterium aphoticum]KLU98388.1 UDP-N-acetylenolpyruvoylglucosamine reductase [Photobacterium aphoticum]PSU52483.1 UDP-N-acetylmuramate dehydrogenase [Photobacterium aphoticum]GHA44603.1 UDP-N-acetylenolpyruvoylglucosamine reductase [Photobacterium aphoticum]
MKVLQDRSLAPFHTFGLTVNAAHIVVVETVDELVAVWRDKQYQAFAKLIVGQGSNLLFCEDFAGVIVVNRIKGITITETDEAFELHVGAGEDWHALVTMTVEKGMPGLENLALIPGCVGSSPIQNIGAYGVELKDVCHYVDVVALESGECTRLMAEECQFGYRESIFKAALKNTHAITAVGLRLNKAWIPHIAYGPLAKFDPATVTATDILHEVCAIRREKLPDPAVMGNAGSFFKNPVVSEAQAQALLQRYPSMPMYPQPHGQCKLAAGWLIDQCALKGHQIGGARVHDQQALVLVNTGTATSADVLALAQYVVDTVAETFGIVLEHEVRFMAASGETCLAEAIA